MVGNYLPARETKSITVKKERVAYWISKGAIPTESVASLFKKEGMPDMDGFLRPGLRKGKKKGEEKAVAGTASAAVMPAVAAPPAAKTPKAEKPAS